MTDIPEELPEVSDDSDGGPGEEAAVTPGPRRARAVDLFRFDAVAFLAVIASVAVISAGVFGARYVVLRHDRQKDAAALAQEDADRAAVSKAAAADFTALSTYDYRNLPAAQAKANAALTPAFRAKYLQNFQQFEASAQQRKSVAVVSTPIVQTLDFQGANTATALVFCDQTVTFGDGGATKVTPYRLTMTLVKQGNSWLADAIELPAAS